MVDWDDDASLIDWAALQQDAGKLLGREVDLVSAKSIHWYVKDRVMAEAKAVA